MNKINIKKVLMNLLSPLIIITFAFLFSSILIISTGSNPLEAFYQLFKGAFGSTASIINTINKAVPICFAGFAVALSKKAGVFNFGVEGQLLMGAFGCTLAGVYLTGLPAFVHIPISILSGMFFGAIYAILPTTLYIKRGTNLLVMCIMMNNIATLLITYLTIGPFAGENKMITATDKIQDSAKLPYLITSPNKLSVGVIIVVIVAIILWVYLNKTTSGYELRMCGANRNSAKYSGIKVSGYVSAALLFSGVLAGLAGSVEIMGNYHRLYDGFSPGYGFDGIPIALLASGNPFGVMIGALLFGALRVGAMNMQTKAGVPMEIISVIQGSLVVLIACESILRFMINKFGKKNREVKA